MPIVKIGATVAEMGTILSPWRYDAAARYAL